VVVLVWVYYSAQILLLGAEFTQVYANQVGSRIHPSEGAEAVTAEARAQQGLPRRDDGVDDRARDEEEGSAATRLAAVRSEAVPTRRGPIGALRLGGLLLAGFLAVRGLRPGQRGGGER
jgi:membrane protein